MLERCPWYIAGPLLGAFMIALRVLVNKPFGALGGYIELAESASKPSRLGFRGYLLLGFVLGGTLFAMTAGTFAPSFAYASLGLRGLTSLPSQLLVLFVAGTVTGFGARTAGGCTSGHGMSGMAIGSPASMVAAMTFFATAVITAHLLASVAGAP